MKQDNSQNQFPSGSLDDYTSSVLSDTMAEIRSNDPITPVGMPGTSTSSASCHMGGTGGGANSNMAGVKMQTSEDNGIILGAYNTASIDRCVLFINSNIYSL